MFGRWGQTLSEFGGQGWEHVYAAEEEDVEAGMSELIAKKRWSVGVVEVDVGRVRDQAAARP